MKVILYQCYSNNSFPLNLFSLLIRLFSKTNYSHYALTYTSESGNTIFCDSSGMGVRQMNTQQFFKHYTVVNAFKCGKEVDREAFLRWFEKHQGKGYGFIQILGLLMRIFHIVKHNPFGKGSKRIICNELIILFLNRFYAANIEDTDSLDLAETEQLIKRLL